MNKKGFTLVEVVVSFSIISVVLASVITFTIIYRDKVREETKLAWVLRRKTNGLTT